MKNVHPQTLHWIITNVYDLPNSDLKDYFWNKVVKANF